MSRPSSGQDVPYALDLNEVVWLGTPGSGPKDRIEIVHLPRGAVALWNAAASKGPQLRYTAAEWEACTLGGRDGEFDVVARS